MMCTGVCLSVHACVHGRVVCVHVCMWFVCVHTREGSDFILSVVFNRDL